MKAFRDEFLIVKFDFSSNSYVHVPPPEDEVAYQQQAAVASAPRKHYKIIFIKAPSAPSYAQQAAVAQAAQNSEKTLIYVLVKKPEEISYDQSVPESSPLAPSKPEVYFIKYKTQSTASAGSSAGGGGGFSSGGGGGGFSSGGGSASGSNSYSSGGSSGGFSGISKT